MFAKLDDSNDSSDGYASSEDRVYYINEFEFERNEYEEEDEAVSYGSYFDSSDGGAMVRKTAALRLVIIGGINCSCHLVFRCEERGGGRSWWEEILLQAINEGESWAQRLNFSKQFFYWYEREVIQLHRNGDPIRLFHIPVAVDRNEVRSKCVMKLCNHICTMLTKSLGNGERIACDERNVLWIEGEVVWGDVVGTRRAVSLIHQQRGMAYEGFYEENEELLLTYFRADNIVLRAQFFRNEGNRSS